MKVSELISVLKELQDKNGDVEVYQKHSNLVFGKVKGASISFRSKSDSKKEWSGFYDFDRGDIVIKI